MKFYSTRNRTLQVTLQTAVIEGIAPNGGLYMPLEIPRLQNSFFQELPNLPFAELASHVAAALIGDDVPASELHKMAEHAVAFDAPLINVRDGIFALELFHGPTLAFKDYGARFLSILLGYFGRHESRTTTVLVATSGDTGSAVANGFLGVHGTRVVVLYPSGKVSEVQEKQFATLGDNITSLEINGSFDDCQALVKRAFADADLKTSLRLTSANSINIARLIPQTFYYFRAFAQMPVSGPVVFSVPSGNYGNLTAGMVAQQMGLPIERFIAATNRNSVVPEFLESEIFRPRPSVPTISNAMDVGNPSNFERMMDLCGGRHRELSRRLVGYDFSDEETREAMRDTHAACGYLLDPHGAVAYLGLKKYLDTGVGRNGIFLETAHPAKFREVVEEAVGRPVDLPDKLRAFLDKPNLSILMKNNFDQLKQFLLALK